MSFLINAFLAATTALTAFVYGGHNSPSGVSGAGTYTYSSAPLGSDHASRQVLVLMSRQSILGSNTAIITIGPSGQVMKRLQYGFGYSGATVGYIEAWVASYPTGSTADIAVTVTGGVGGLNIFVGSIYGCAESPLDLVLASGTGTSLSLPDIQTEAGGAVAAIVLASINGGAVTFTESWTGADTVVEDLETNSADSNHRVCHMHLLTAATSSTDDLAVTLSTSKIYAGFALSFGPTGGPVDIYTSNWHAQSRGDRTSSNVITVTTDATTGGGTLNNLVDGAFASNGTDAWWWTNGQSGRKLRFNFGSARIVNQMRWYQSSAATHGVWAMFGSNDGSSFTRLSNDFTLGGQLIFNYRWFNGTAYQYYELQQQSGTTSSGPWLQEVEFCVADSGGAARSEYERGYRNHLINITTTATLAGGTIQALLDNGVGDNSTESCFFTASQSTREVRLRFRNSVQKIVTGFLWFQDVTSTHGTWSFEGSNDGSSWTGLDTGFTLGGFRVQERTFANSTAYEYHRLVQTAGTTSGTPYLMELELRIT